MKLKLLLVLQLLYVALGIGYNIASHLSIASGGKALSATAPLTGGVTMALYGLCLLPGFFGVIVPYRILMGIAVLVFGYGGIVKHLLNYPGGLVLYASKAAFVVAVAINVYGLVLNLIAALGRFRNR